MPNSVSSLPSGTTSLQICPRFPGPAFSEPDANAIQCPELQGSPEAPAALSLSYWDRRVPGCGFVNRDEAHVLYNTALATAIGQRSRSGVSWLVSLSLVSGGRNA